MALRTIIQRPLDEVQYLADLVPGLPYQPLPWLGLQRAKRGTSTEDRWLEIEKIARTENVQTAMDIGCNVGYFCHRLSEIGVAAIGLEKSKRYYRLAMRTADTLGSNRPAFLNSTISPASRLPLPKVDMVILLSVWHHWVREFGIEAATGLLKRVWALCDRVMVFETGESEVQESYNLPDMLPDPRSWLSHYLGRVLDGGHLTHLGVFKAFAPGGNESERVVYRNLFKISRSI